MKTILLKPFERYQETHLLIVGLIAMILGAYVASILNTRFDGVLDLHFGDAVSFQTAIIDNTINLLSLFIPLLVLGKVINTQTRIIDLFNVVLISRIPFYLLPPLNYTGLITESANELMVLAGDPMAINDVSTFSIFIVIAFAVLSLAVLIWSIALVYNGFKTSVNLKNKIHNYWFGLSILIAEIISKFLIVKFN